jgi:hypothetical protein
MFRSCQAAHPLLQQLAIPPGLQGQPVRQYPLRQHNELALFVLGEKQGPWGFSALPAGSTLVPSVMERAALTTVA